MRHRSTDWMMDLNDFADGAFREKVSEALLQVGENIQNPNTEPTTKRKINITLTFAPSKNRQVVDTQIMVTTKLASTEAIETQMLMGTDMRTGEVMISEYDGNIPGQMSIRELAQTAPEVIGEDNARIINAQVVEEPDPATPPIDLRNRGKRIRGAAALAPIPGVDVDPETGEILDLPNYDALAKMAAES